MRACVCVCVKERNNNLSNDDNRHIEYSSRVKSVYLNILTDNATQIESIEAYQSSSYCKKKKIFGSSVNINFFFIAIS